VAYYPASLEGIVGGTPSSAFAYSSVVASLTSHSEAVEGALKALSKWFIGWPTDNMNDIYEHAYRGKFYRGGEVLMSALSGLDIALWDLKGKRLGVPVWSLLGGLVRDKVRVCPFTIWNSSDGRTNVDKRYCHGQGLQLDRRRQAGRRA
jgi:L-alanine-DL-glutamate epimerase-like enolase superfamily enzyme